MEPHFDLDKMTVAEKLHATERLGEDLSRNPEDIPSPAWHEEVLTARQREIDEGRATFLSLDECHNSIMEKIKTCET
jgi:hypothetical protein